MSLKNLIKIAEAKSNNSELPNWVSEKNITIFAFNYINQLKKGKLDFIGKHNKVNDFRVKGKFHISASEIARHINVATTTLISTSAYSKDLKSYLDSVNVELEKAKELKFSKHKKTLHAGLKQHKKDEIRIELQITRKELKELKEKNAIEQARLILESLGLPIKHKLGIC